VNGGRILVQRGATSIPHTLYEEKKHEVIDLNWKTVWDQGLHFSGALRMVQTVW
jgi:hypothetical protein